MQIRVGTSGYSHKEWDGSFYPRPVLDEAYVFFKHEDEGKGPAFAARFGALWRGSRAIEQP